MRRALLSGVAAALAIVWVAGAVGACGAEDGSGAGTTTTGVETQVLTIEEALAAEPGATVRVRGALVATGTGDDVEAVLASVLLESYPPQAGGAILPLADFDLNDVVGLTSTVDQPGVAPVTWSDFWFVVEGVIADGTLQVKTLPRVVTATIEAGAIRFSPVAEPYIGGETAWWALDVRNTGSQPLVLTFSSGQRADVVLSQGGVEKYRWSDGKAFTEAIEEVTIEPGKALAVTLNDVLDVSPGDYDLTAIVTATAGQGGGDGGVGPALPRLSTTITVF